MNSEKDKYTKKVVRFLIEPHDLFLYHYLTG